MHVDLDDLWAIAECYGIRVDDEQRHLVCLDALPRLRALFDNLRIRATLFVVGSDLANAEIADQLRLCLGKQQLANHSFSHRLDFRALPGDVMAEEINRAAAAIEDKLGTKPVGFRAPGYGFSEQLATTLAEHGYLYDSSLMPGPYGFVFRWVDARLQKQAGERVRNKTQYSTFGDARRPISPFRVAGTSLLELPAATSPFLRLPFQAGVCMRLGRRYFDMQLRAFAKRPGVPFVFLMHAADIADFTMVRHPFFQQVGYFKRPVAEKTQMLEYFLRQINETRTVTTMEEWLSSGAAESFIRAS